jgi:hypothetical protein
MKVTWRLLSILFAFAIGSILVGCLSANATPNLLVVASATSTFLPIAIPTTNVVGTETPPLPTSTPTEAPTETPTPLPSGQVLRSVLVEVKPSSGIECSRSEVWMVASPYTVSQPFLRDNRISYRSPRWSHNGQTVAYIEEINSETRIGLINQDGSSPRPLSPVFPYVANETSCTGLLLYSWSLSDQWLAFEQVNFVGKFFRRLHILNALTGQTILVDENPYGYPPSAWSPQEDTLAYVGVTYDKTGHRVIKISLQLAQVQSDGNVRHIEIQVPEGFEIDGRGDRIRGLAWQSDAKLLVVVSPTLGSDPATLFEVDVSTGVWQPVAKYQRNLETEKYPPSQVQLSPKGTRIAWVGNELLVLDTTVWKEVARLQASWLDNPLVSWITDSNSRPLLVFNDDSSLWVYDTELDTRRLLIDQNIFPRGLAISDVAWEP